MKRQENPQLILEGSPDGTRWQELDVRPASFVNAESNYNYLVPRIYSFDREGDFRYIKIRFKGLVDIARVEVLYINSFFN